VNQVNQAPENLDDFLKTLAIALLAWQVVESNLFLIFNFLVGQSNPAALSAVYHSVVSINTRREMVNAAAAVVLKDKQCLKEWGKLSERIRKRAKERNKLAHFELVFSIDNKGEREALLKPSIFNVKAEKEWEKKYDIKQIREWHRLFIALVGDLSKFLGNLPSALRA